MFLKMFKIRKKVGNYTYGKCSSRNNWYILASQMVLHYFDIKDLISNTCENQCKKAISPPYFLSIQMRINSEFYKFVKLERIVISNRTLHHVSVRNISCLPLTMLYKGDNSCVSGYR
jgi:hypothetical protein